MGSAHCHPERDVSRRDDIDHHIKADPEAVLQTAAPWNMRKFMAIREFPSQILWIRRAKPSKIRAWESYSVANRYPLRPHLSTLRLSRSRLSRPSNDELGCLTQAEWAAIWIPIHVSVLLLRKSFKIEMKSTNT